MSTESFIAQVREYCAWVEGDTHDAPTGYRLLRALLAGTAGLETPAGQRPDRGCPGLPQEIRRADTKRFADFPFQCYRAVFWPGEVHPEGSFTEDIHEDFLHIYAELGHGLQFIDQGDTTTAIKYWRDSYFFHWGHHASAAIWAIEQHGLEKQSGEPAGASNGSPAAPVGDSGASEGPPPGPPPVS